MTFSGFLRSKYGLKKSGRREQNTDKSPLNLGWAGEGNGITREKERKKLSEETSSDRPGGREK